MPKQRCRSGALQHLLFCYIESKSVPKFKISGIQPSSATVQTWSETPETGFSHDAAHKFIKGVVSYMHVYNIGAVLKVD